MNEKPPPHRTHLHGPERKAVMAPPSCLRVFACSVGCFRQTASGGRSYGRPLPLSPVREGLVDDPTGDVLEHILPQRHGEPPVERWEEDLESLHDALRAHLRAARVPATRGAAISVVAARTATVVETDTVRAPPATVAVVTGASDTAPVVGLDP